MPILMARRVRYSQKIWSFNAKIHVVSPRGFCSQPFSISFRKKCKFMGNFSIFKVNCSNNYSICRKFYTCRLLDETKKYQKKLVTIWIFNYIFLSKESYSNIKKLSFKGIIARQKSMWYVLPCSWSINVCHTPQSLLATNSAVILSWKYLPF